MENVCGEILKVLKENGLAKEANLARKIDCSEQEVKEALRTLEETFKISKTRDGYYEVIETKNKKVGRLRMTDKGYGFVQIDGEEEVLIPSNKLRGCIHNDIVLIRTNECNGRLQGIVEKRLSRNTDILVGEVKYIDGCEYIIPDNPKYKLKVRFRHDDSIVLGHKVTFRLAGEVKEDIMAGEIEEIIGHKDEPGVDILSVIKAYNVPTVFSKEIMDEVKALPLTVTEQDLVGRLDLRDKMIFTIDGDDTKDIDDAISLDILENGNYLLGGHIADVSYYVKPGTLLDEEAKARGTSIYMVDRVLPMLPQALSNGICSLNPNVDRLTLSFFVEIDNKGNIVSFDVKESVINSNKQMTYKNVNKILEEDTIPEGYELYASKLKEMQTLAHILREKRVKRGSVDFDIDEIKINIDQNGKVSSVGPRIRGEGEKLIEDFMIAINEAGAEFANNLDIPFLYRVHDLPREEKIEELVNTLAGLEYDATKIIRNNYIKYPIVMQKLLVDLKDRDDYAVLAKRILRSVKKAQYSKDNDGHFALASNAYSHLTSPIRRYPDLENHRILKTLAIYNQYEEQIIDKLINEVAKLGEHVSNRERIAQDLEREVDKMKIAEYMENHVGEEYTGLISELGLKGLYVQLPNLVEGKVSFDHYKDKVVFNNENYTVKNINKNLIYKLGMPLKIKVMSASKERRTVDFSIVQEEKPKELKKVKYGNNK